MKKLALIVISLSSLSIIGCSNSGDRGSCFIVKPLSGDNYQTTQFEKAYLASENHVTTISNQGDNFSYLYKNLLPHDVNDAYHVAIFSVELTNNNEKTYECYFLYEEKIYAISPWNTQNSDGLTSVAFTDLNNDGYYEVSAAYRISGANGSISYITVFDSKSQLAIQSNSYYGNTIDFRKENGQIAIYCIPDTIGHPDDKKGTKSDILQLYSREFSFTKSTYKIETKLYHVEVILDQFQTQMPVYFDHLVLHIEVAVNMAYLGESYTYTGSYYIEGATVEFYQGDWLLMTEGYLVDQGLTEHTITPGTHIDRTYYFHDQNCGNKLGSYDMKVKYRDVEAVEEGVLTIK